MSETSCSLSSESKIPHQTDITEELIPLDRIQSLPYAVRENKQDGFEKLYQSIKEEGLQQPLVVARPPDTKEYVLIAGGNTRFEFIQRLDRESRGSRFHEIRCVVIPWPGMCAAKVSHLITNDVLHNASFIERAKAVLNFIDGNSDLPIDRTTSDRGVSKFFTEHGYPLYRTTYAAMKYAVDFLNLHLPVSLASSLSALDVKHIQKLESKYKRAWIEAGRAESEFDQLFAEVARSCDHEDLDYETLHNVLTEQIVTELQDIEENPGSTVLQELPGEDNPHTEPVPRDTAVELVSDTSPTNIVTKDETSSTSNFLSLSSEQEPSEQIRNLAIELARQFGFQDCITLGEQGEFGFLVIDLPSEDASQTTRLIWEYLANFSGACEMSKEELMPFLSPDSKLYNEFQESETSTSLQTAKELDLSVMWTIESESFELLLQLWRLVFEHTEFKLDLDDTAAPIESDQQACVAA